MSDQILVSVNGYYTLNLYTPGGDSVEEEEVTKVILPLLQDGTYMIAMGEGRVLRIDDWKTMYTFEIPEMDVEYEFFESE